MNKRVALPAQFSLRDTDLIFRVFSGEELVTVYDARNGDTHLLGEVAYELCQFLADSPATADELKRRMLLNFPEDDPDLITDGVDAALMQLEGAGFIFAAAN
ncbi:HPr-rel-A system PqqD family peptide chaperone [Dechloromonas denitrificans]|uniref:HPr-rel-A system PqqD family peptide chaperone n=1 Tax=Dechloromonas denitrificans TaxID=281362 RepID=UPI001CF840D9|nr:HPr-rel-A system PqqD family peptide chaperone [Dechloromonas denitrificans]UCV05533.1 HPr-rel-A system PqqD family peptide chaperone [Dechloromonas denitrificans]UCV09880.1 HPr-rel-A system PqqD family peptide chaperone [Dechloromonas denitrificans]